MLAVTGVSLYLVAPSLIKVLSSWPEVARLEPALLLVMLALESASFFCLWLLQRLSLHRPRWFPVITSQLAGNAFGRIVPGGGAAAGALQYTMLVDAGVKPAAAASGLTASSLMTTGMVLVLPVLALPAILIGGSINPSLAKAAWAGLAAFAVMGAAGAILMTADRPLRSAGRAIQRVRNAVLRRRRPLTDLPGRLVDERDLILGVLGERWWEALLATVGRWGFDYFALLAALAAVGQTPSLSAVLLAFCAAQVLTLVPITPGGLGFVEAGLTGTLALAGVGAGDAVVATLAYRLVSYWLPMPAGLAAAIAHRRRYGGQRAEAAAESAG
jgi:hypothetical protein